MPDESKPNVLEAFRKYLSEANLTPGYIGAALGAGASALYTADQPGETPAQRAKRLIRNALIGGGLGGVGSQALAEGFRGTAEIAGNNTPASDKHNPSWVSGPLARLGYGIAGTQLGRVALPYAGLPSTRLRQSVERAFGASGLGHVPIDRRHYVDFDVPQTNSIPDRLDHAKGMLNQIRNANVLDTTGTKAKGMMDTLMDHLGGTARERDMGGAGPLRRWLLAEGVPASEKTFDIVTARLRGLDRAFNSFTPHSTSRLGRWAGRSLSLGSGVAGFLTPDILNASGRFIDRQLGKVNPMDIPTPGRVVEVPAEPLTAWDKLNKGFKVF